MMRAKMLTAAVGMAALVLGPLAPVLGDFGAAPAFAKNGNGGGNGGGNKGGKSGNKGGTAETKQGKSSTKGGKKPTKVAAPSSTTELPLPPNAHGKMASELKGLNAYHASETAFANASPNSQVGRLAAYRDAALETITAGDDLDSALSDLDAANAKLAESEMDLQALDDGHAGRTTAEIDADIAALDPNASDYQSKFDGLTDERLAAETYETERASLVEQIAANEAAVTDAEGDVTDAEAALADAEMAEGEALSTAANGRTLSDPALEFLREQLGL